jgi:hypothetical protein
MALLLASPWTSAADTAEGVALPHVRAASVDADACCPASEGLKGDETAAGTAPRIAAGVVSALAGTPFPAGGTEFSSARIASGAVEEPSAGGVSVVKANAAMAGGAGDAPHGECCPLGCGVACVSLCCAGVCLSDAPVALGPDPSWSGVHFESNFIHESDPAEIFHPPGA